MLGSGLTSFALGVWIFQQSGKATPFALTVLFGSLPRVLLAPIAGSMVDRYNRRWLMILADTASALLTLGVFIALQFSSLQMWMIFLVAALSSAFSAFQEPAYQAAITMIVPKKDLARASGLGSLGSAIQSLITPVLAGFLFIAIGLHGIILIDFATFFFAIGALFLVKIPQPVKNEAAGAPINAQARKPSIWSDAVFGWKYLRAKSGLFNLLWFYALVNFFLSFSMVLLGPMVLSAHSAREYGFVETAIGLGILVGSLALSSWGGPKSRKVPWVIGFIAIAAVGLTLAGLSPHIAPILGGMFIMLDAIPLASGISQSLFQTKVAPNVQGRVFAIRGMIASSVTPLANAISGPLADLALEPSMQSGGILGGSFVGMLIGSGPGRGIGLGFVISGLILLAACLWAFANRRLRHIETDLPDEI